jgi:hypothetical protein
VPRSFLAEDISAVFRITQPQFVKTAAAAAFDQDLFDQDLLDKDLFDQDLAFD